MVIASLAAIVPLLREKSTYPGGSDLPNHLCQAGLVSRLLNIHGPD
jgi:hypothetical protein